MRVRLRQWKHISGEEIESSLGVIWRNLSIHRGSSSYLHSADSSVEESDLDVRKKQWRKFENVTILARSKRWVYQYAYQLNLISVLNGWNWSLSLSMGFYPKISMNIGPDVCKWLNHAVLKSSCQFGFENLGIHMDTEVVFFHFWIFKKK